jgi:hypothetical protein
VNLTSTENLCHFLEGRKGNQKTLHHGGLLRTIMGNLDCLSMPASLPRLTSTLVCNPCHLDMPISTVAL